MNTLLGLILKIWFFKLRVFFNPSESPMTTINEYTTTEVDSDLTNRNFDERKKILEATFTVNPAIRSTSGSEDEMNEIALILDESSTTAYHVRTDLCGPYEYESHSFDPDKGYTIAK